MMGYSLTPSPHICIPRCNNSNVPRGSNIRVNFMPPRGYPQGRRRQAPAEPQQRGNKSRCWDSKVVPMSIQ
eukprot:6429082-Pyramimonas_sp.AAC.1